MTTSLQALTPDLCTLALPLRVGSLQLGTRTSVVRLADGGLWVHSPGPLRPDQCDAIRALGPVRALVASNCLHHLHLAEAQRAFPDAQSYGAPGLPAKRADLEFAAELQESPPEAWRGVLEQHVVGGMPSVNEVAFFHAASRTLLLTDICFHLLHVGSRLQRVLLRLNDAYGRFGMTRYGRSLVRDRPALRRSIDRLLEWDFDRVLVTHGEVLESGGREALRESFDWL
ncbi:MAG: DUF4336 domain-containing protein [Proteobacteria bacterium]|nr:DUF4336 domain-containing protein [Pseudomonadota bacterium]